MSIVIIGGNERMEREYKSICKDFGFKSKVFTTMSSKVSKSIGNPDAIVIFTATVSHKMSKKAEEEAKKKNIPIHRIHSSGKVALMQCMKNIDECKGDCKQCKCIHTFN